MSSSNSGGSTITTQRRSDYATVVVRHLTERCATPHHQVFSAHCRASILSSSISSQQAASSAGE